MIYRVEVCTKPGLRDARGENLRQQAIALGIRGIEAISVTDLYFLLGDLDDGTARQLADALLYDPVVEEVWIDENHRLSGEKTGSSTHSVEVAFRPGVTDSVAESLLQGARMLGLNGLERAATAHRYMIASSIDEVEVKRIAEGLLANAVIQTHAIDRPVDPPFVPVEAADDTVESVPLTDADEAELLAISQRRRLALDLPEMAAIQAYFRRQGRQPTDIELEMLAQTWSEHCIHKSFRALIDYQESAADGTPLPASRRQIDSLLSTYIRAATEKVNKPWVHSAFVDNAGIVAFDDCADLAFKVETHNHPSALEPFGGANTGVGGVVRDVIGVSARPIANTDVLCFGPQDLPFAELPTGVLHPRRIADGVTAGVEDYGNKMGIPTVNGAILYDPGYTDNPLVFCGCLGILPRGSHRADPQAGDLVVVIGGRTGRDGLRGATFSSMEMSHETGRAAGSAVQIGHPIHEKQTLEAVLVARDEGLYTAITDCGAGGLSSAVGEMAAELGAEVHLERVLLKYAGLRPWEIWLSEAQERMVLAVPPSNWPRMQEICNGLDLEATALGTFTGDGLITLRYEGRVVGQLESDFLHHGIPRRHLSAAWVPPAVSEPMSAALPVGEDKTACLLGLLAMPDTRSKEDVVRRYDHEVQGGSVVKPFVGATNAGPSDAAVLDLRFAIADLNASQQGAAIAAGINPAYSLLPTPYSLSFKGVAISAGINPSYSAIDPYAMAWAAVDEAVRNCVAVGADPDQLALLDNFCWGNPTLPDRLGGLVRCAQGCYDAAVAYGTPFVSGKDSLNNEFTGADGHKQAIPGTLLISALAIVPDVTRSVTMDLKDPGDWLYIVGMTADELGGSAYYRLQDLLGANVPQPPKQSLEIFRALHRAIAGGLVRACHDCSEGGLAVAAAEMSLSGGLGLELNLGKVPCAQGMERDDTCAFSESLARFVVEVAPGDAQAFESYLAGLPAAQVGRVRADKQVTFSGLAGKVFIQTGVDALEQAWRGHIQ